MDVFVEDTSVSGITATISVTQFKFIYFAILCDGLVFHKNKKGRCCVRTVFFPQDLGSLASNLYEVVCSEQLEDNYYRSDYEHDVHYR